MNTDRFIASADAKIFISIASYRDPDLHIAAYWQEPGSFSDGGPGAGTIRPLTFLTTMSVSGWLTIFAL